MITITKKTETAMRKSRDFDGIIVLIVFLTGVSAQAVGQGFDVDYASLVSRADITYTQPVTRSEEGLPVGNGRMGSLVWTTPEAIKFQINRADVYAENCTTCSFPRADRDYASGCGYVDINLVDYGETVFAGDKFRQHLGVYDGLMTAQGSGVTARVLAWHRRDIMAVEIEDNRERPEPISVDLRMLRYVRQYNPGKEFDLSNRHIVKVRTVEHTAESQLDIRDGRIILTQQFREMKYYDASAVAIAVVGRESKARYYNEMTVRLTAAPGRGRFVLLIASAGCFDPKQDVAGLAIKELDAAADQGFDALLTDNKVWWHDFWSKSFIRLHSQDGAADFVEQNYNYFLYVMASSSRGAYPPRFGGMLWYTTGDMRAWGSQHWGHNLECYYVGLSPANRFELMDPMFNMYSGMYESCATAAKQQWGSEGIWIPETTWFDGLEKLPDDIAAEMRDLYLVRKPWSQRSERFLWFAKTKSRYNSRWGILTGGRLDHGNWVDLERDTSPFAYVTHIFSTTAKISYLYWLRYEYTQDKDWLRNRAYPMIKGTIEFYRHFPNLKKADDGKYHIYHVNNSEPIWDAQDTMEELSAMHGMTPILIRASEILGVDAELRPLWREFLENLTPLPSSDLLSNVPTGAPRRWIRAIGPAREGSPEAPDLVQTRFYDLCTVGTLNDQIKQTSKATYEAIYADGVSEKTAVSVLSYTPVAAAHLGRSADIKYMIPNQIRCLSPEHDFCDWDGSGQTAVMSNRLTLREGPGAMDCQRLGMAAEALHAALLQSVPPVPGGDPILYLFPAWPVDWDVDFSLLARGAFLVTASMEKGKIEFVEIRSQAGGECRLRNPWPGAASMLYCEGKEAEQLSGAILTFPTTAGQILTLVPKGSVPAKKVVR
jgi:hypothetical protein